MEIKIYDASTIPDVHPMMMRKITPLGGFGFFGGVMAIDKYGIEEIGMAESRLGYDEDVVDCSRRVQDITFITPPTEEFNITAFPSRRWRNNREGETITGIPSKDNPMIYIGNPIKIFFQGKSIQVIRIPEFIIKSGMDLQLEDEMSRDTYQNSSTSDFFKSFY